MRDFFQFRTIFRSQSTIAFSGILCLLLCQCSSDPQKRPSPLRTDTTTVGGVDIYLEFSSPGVKNREIFGSGEGYLVPYNELWRTGANHSTYLSVDGPIRIGAAQLDSGSYSIFTIPNQDEWTLILNKDWDQWGSYNYKDSLDAFRIKVKPKYADQSQERLLFYFADDSLKFRWDKVRWSVSIN